MKVKFEQDRGIRKKGDVVDYDDEQYAKYLIEVEKVAKAYEPRTKTAEEKAKRNTK